MADTTNPPDRSVMLWKAALADAPTAGRTERLVRDTWRHYYVARLAEAQFGPESLEASIAHSHALASYRELRGSLRKLDPYYRPAGTAAGVQAPATRHLTLLRGDAAESDMSDGDLSSEA